jgi:hypothetical protein
MSRRSRHAGRRPLAANLFAECLDLRETGACRRRHREREPPYETLLSAHGLSRAATSGRGEAAASRLAAYRLSKEEGVVTGLKGCFKLYTVSLNSRHLVFSRSRRWLLRGLSRWNGRMPSAPISCLHQDRGERRRRWMMHWWRRAVTSTRRASHVKALAHSILCAVCLVKTLRLSHWVMEKSRAKGAGVVFVAPPSRRLDAARWRTLRLQMDGCGRPPLAAWKAALRTSHPPLPCTSPWEENRALRTSEGRDCGNIHQARSLVAEASASS